MPALPGRVADTWVDEGGGGSGGVTVHNLLTGRDAATAHPIGAITDLTTQLAALIPLAQKAANNGVATLDAGGKIPAAQIPALALSEFLGTVASEAAMLALVGQRGDWCIRTDLDPDSIFILESDDPTQAANWTNVTGAGVVSVDGFTGAVDLSSVYMPAASAEEISFYETAAALLEPLAIEAMQTGAFAYVIGAGVTKWMLSAWGTRIGATGRLDLRETREPIPLRGVTINGTNPDGATSTAAFIDPALPSYADAKETYFERINAIAEAQTHYVGFDGGTAYAPLIPGPYGNILVGFTFHDTAWLGMVTPRGPAGSLLPIHDEIGDAAGDDLRMARKLYMPVTKNIMSGLLTGAAGGPQAVQSGMAYMICPADWGAVADPLAPYDFRDDFMGAAIDTAAKWTRAQSTVGNVEINTDFAACKLRGNGNWGDNGLFTQAGQARATGLTFLIDILVRAAVPNLIVGFHDGAGQSFSDFSHGLYFTTDGVVTPTMYVFENGNNRGPVGASYTANCLYRVRITLSASSNVAVYEIQGGTQYPAVGGAAWTALNPGTASNSATTPLHAGASVQSANDNYISDPRVYS